MLYEVMQQLNNFFDRNKDGQYWNAYEGEWTVKDLAIDLTGKIEEGQFYRIEGSRFNDGIYSYGEPLIMDEEFSGKIYEMRVPAAFLNKVSEIEEWQTKNGEAAASPYTSESFGGYSYQKAAAGTENAATWQTQFKKDLRPWRKI